jgi:SAM-dependent methyltransferase
MGVATHLGIKLSEYDARIRTFIPDYEEMLDAAAAAIPTRTKIIVDLGIGTGALASCCMDKAKAKQARVVGIDVDAEIMKLAKRRLGRRATFLCGSFLGAEIPPCDAVVASFALHHVPTQHAKTRLYDRIHDALANDGVLVTVDCHPARDPELARKQRLAWTSHLRKTYSRSEADELLTSWSHEDFYMPLEVELELMRQSAFAAEVLWRRGAFAVLMGKPQ